MDQPMMFTDWRETKRLTLLPEDAADYERDPEAFALRHVTGRIQELVMQRGPDGFTELVIEYQPIATEPCTDCLNEGVATPARATHEDRRGGGIVRICHMHQHHGEMLRRGRSESVPDWVYGWAHRIGVEL